MNKEVEEIKQKMIRHIEGINTPLKGKLNDKGVEELLSNCHPERRRDFVKELELYGFFNEFEARLWIREIDEWYKTKV